MMLDDDPAPAPHPGDDPGGESAPAPSPAMARFESCRWRATGNGQVPPHCSHRDVLPVAGTSGFVIESWCGDCAFYKLRRTPRRT